jgi:ribose transport system ATP-binding protein
MLFGAYPIASGEVLLDGKPLRAANPQEAMRAGIAYVPEERQADALLLGESVRHNLSAGQAWSFYRNLFFRHREEKVAAARSISEFLVRTSTDRQPVDNLSGGNQQKVVLARWLRQRPKVLLLDEPTQGVDVGARAEIYDLVRRATAAGTSVILVASDTEELARASDRVAILRGGRIRTVVEQPLDAHHLTELMNVSEAAP